MKGDDRPPPNRPAVGRKSDDGDVAGSENNNRNGAESTTVVSESEVQPQQQPDREEQGDDDASDASTMALYTSRVLHGASGAISTGESVSDGTSAIASFASTDESYEGLSQLTGAGSSTRRRSYMSQPGAYAVTPFALPQTSLRRSTNGTSVDDSSNPSRRPSDPLSTTCCMPSVSTRWYRKMVHVGMSM